MLTNAYYYNMYRPYILGKRESNSIVAKRSRIAEVSPQDKLDRGMVIVLNKSLKDDIVNYARNVSHGVTGFKTAVHTTLTDMGGFALNSMYNGFNSAVSLLDENLTNFANTYNKGSSYLRNQEQSTELRSFSQGLQQRVYQGSDRLGLLGLNVQEEGAGIIFDGEYLHSLSQIEVHAAIGANMQLFHSLHQNTTEMLTEPLSSHMNFRGLNYHYNYQLGRIVEDGFGIIESGMIVDRVV